jgi:uncharacterized protein
VVALSSGRPQIGPGAGNLEHKDLFEVQIEHNCMIVCPDGTELAGDIYRPRDTAPCPALITMLPYHKDAIGGVTSWNANHYFAERGYATVLVDFRGTGASGGRPRPLFDPAEAEDGAVAVEWAATQPWCDGTVGMWGVSYGAVVALRTASLGPAPLRAVLSVMGLIDPERDLIHPSGLRGCLGPLGVFGLTTLVQQLMPPIHQDPAGDWERRWRQRLEAEPYLLEILRLGPGAEEWRSRAIDATSISVPTFLIGGWRDVDCDSTIRAYEQLKGPKKLLVGPWMHTEPDQSSFEPVDFLPLALSWWSRWLHPGGGGTGAREATAEAPVELYLEGRGAWCQVPAWPVPGTSPLLMQLGPDKRCTEGTGPALPLLKLSSDATVGAASALGYHQARGLALPPDQSAENGRSLSFTSELLGGALVICGRPKVTAVVRCGTGAGHTFVAKLLHVAPDGSSSLITWGARALATHDRNGSAENGLLDETVPVEMAPTAYEVPEGHSLRLRLHGGEFPRLWPERTGDVSVLCPVEGVRLELPVTVALPTGTAMPAPARTPLSLVLRADPLYRVSRDAVADQVKVTIGDHILMRSPDQMATIELNWFATATVDAERPDAAVVSGRATVHAGTARGEFRVRADILISAAAAAITGEVSLAGVPQVSRRWVT